MNEPMIVLHAVEVKLVGGLVGLIFMSIFGLIAYAIKKAHGNTVCITQNQAAIIAIQKTCRDRLESHVEMVDMVGRIERNMIRIGIHADVPDLETKS